MRVCCCDRCGREVKRPFIVRYPATYKVKAIGREFLGDWMTELCDSCKEDFLRWLRKE